MIALYPTLNEMFQTSPAFLVWGTFLVHCPGTRGIGDRAQAFLQNSHKWTIVDHLDEETMVVRALGSAGAMMLIRGPRPCVFSTTEDAAPPSGDWFHAHPVENHSFLCGRAEWICKHVRDARVYVVAQMYPEFQLIRVQ